MIQTLPTEARQVWLPYERRRGNFTGRKALLCFGFEALAVNGARSWIRCGDLTGDLFAERHAGHRSRRAGIPPLSVEAGAWPFGRLCVPACPFGLLEDFRLGINAAFPCSYLFFSFQLERQSTALSIGCSWG
jgi:hypothetical protein